jgi:hypothetical protein
MLDENLPCFYLKPSRDSARQDATICLSQYGSDASPVYTLRHPDLASPDSRNRYAAALYDSYNPEVLFGEVLLIPEWSQSPPSAEEIRQNGGIPPPPQPMLPNEFVIQLYNPDQQIVVRQNSGSWNSAQSWTFEMPQITFRQPSTSTLDRTQSDPFASETTPTISFRWKRDGKLSKDLVCNLSGKSANPDGSKRKHKEPDIPLSFFRNLRELTVYEPNLSRVEMEDPKGFEIVLLLSAAVIRDVYFRQLREAFNITEDSLQGSRQHSLSSPTTHGSESKVLESQQHPQPPPPTHAPPNPSTGQTHGGPQTLSSNTRPPPTDPRSQWEIDAETARLRKQVEAEERERKRVEKAEARKIKKMLEEEEKAEKRRQEEIEKETERLRRKYGVDPPQLPPRNAPQSSNSAPVVPQQHAQWSQYSQAPYVPSNYPVNPYLQPQASSSGPQRTPKPKRSSFFGLRGGSGESDEPKLTHKRSAVF